MICLLLLGVAFAGVLTVSLAPARLAGRLFVTTTALVLLLAVALVAGFHLHRPGLQEQLNVVWVPAVGSRLHLGIDGVSLPLVVLTALLTLVCAAVLPRDASARPLAALLLLLEVGMLGTFLAADLLVFFVSFETVLVPMYFIIRFWGGPDRDRAATTFLLYTLLGSVAMLLGLLAIATGSGTLDMVRLAAEHGRGIPPGIQLVAFLALLVGFGVKAPLWPLHSWLPSAHTEAPTAGSVLLAGVLLKMGTYGLVRIAVGELPQAAHTFAPVLGGLAVVGICYAAFACLAQTDVKRLIAYSSVGHMGFVLLGIATLTPVGINGALFANVAHGLITGMLFLLAGAIKDRYHTADLREIGGGLLAKAPYLGGVLVFASVASLGLPGLAGFWGEFLALLGAFHPAAGLPRPLFLGLMAAAGVGLVLTTGYFLRLIRSVAHGVVPPSWRTVVFSDVGGGELAAWTPLVVLIVVFGLDPGLLLRITDPAVHLLLGGR